MDYFEDILNSLPEQVAVIRRDGVIDFVNNSWSKFSSANSGHLAKTGIGVNYFDVCKRADKSAGNVLSELEKVARGEKEGFELEYPCHSPTEKRWFLMLVKPVEEQPSKIVISHINITDRKNLEEKLRIYSSELERSNEELQEFASIAAHDLKAPLRNISNLGGFLKKKISDLDNETNNYIDKIENATIRMSTLIDDLLEMAAVNTKPKSFKRHNLDFIAQDSLFYLEEKIVKTKGAVNINDLPSAEVDQTQIRQLFQNLIGNSLKYHREGISPIVNISSESSKDSKVKINIEDNGIGFDEKYNEKIFQPFQRLHGKGDYEGNGVGLAICKKIVDRHHGTITVKSTEGVGSTFIITLPETQPNY